MNILFLNSFLYPRGGDTTCMFLQAQALSAHGHTLLPFATRHPDNQPTWLDPYYPACPDPQNPTPLDILNAPWSFRAATALDRLLRHIPIDIAHAHHLHRHLTPSVLRVLKKHGIPVVWTLHDYELLCPTGLMYRENKLCTLCKGQSFQHAMYHQCLGTKTLLRVVEKLVHRLKNTWDLVDHFLVPSQFLFQQLKNAGVPNLIHIPNPVAPAPPRPPGSGWLVAGRLTPEKGLEDALMAGVPGLTVCGDGPERARMERQYPGVRWLGHVSPERLQEELGRARVVVVPSRWPENQPYAVLEAQAMGRPVVATRVGGIPELITHNETGFLVEPGKPEEIRETLNRLIENLALCTRIGEQARQSVRSNHDLSQHIDTLLHIYRSLIGARSFSGSPSPIQSSWHTS